MQIVTECNLKKIGTISAYNECLQTGKITTSDNKVYMFLKKDLIGDWPIQKDSQVVFRGEIVAGDLRAYYIKIQTYNTDLQKM